MPLVINSQENIGYEEELTVCLVKETTETEESALTCHLSKRLGNANATFVIINLLTRNRCLDNNDDIVLMDSHLPFPKGALLAKERH